MANATVAVGPTLTASDELGCFEVVGLPRGTFTVYAQGSDSPSLGTATFTTTGPDDAQAVVVTLEPIGSIEGTVFEADGVTRKTAQKVQLWLGPNDGVIAETYTNSEGRFSFPNYPVGAYSLRAIDPTTLDGGMTNTEIRFAGDTRVANVQFRGLGVIEGRVVQAGDPPRTGVIADVVIVRKVWKIVVDSSLNEDLAIQVLNEFAQIEGLEGAVKNTIGENNLGSASAEFFMLVDEPALVKSDLLGPGGEVTGDFRFEGPTAAGPFTVSALSTFLRPAVVSSAIPNTTVAEERTVDVGEIVLQSATGKVRGTVYLPDGETPLTYETADPQTCDGAEVTIRSLGDSGSVLVPGVGQVQQDTPPELTQQLCSDGTFEFPLVLAGRFALSVDTLVPTLPPPSTPGEIQTEIAEELNVRLYGRASGSAPAGDEFVTVDVRLHDAAAVKVNV
ncbi:MAG: carboxypeptidase-like regulatory domain-containing protein, partial [Planctomycetota bacterium]